MSARTAPAGSPFPVDAHVHFHRFGRIAPTLDAATINFARACRSAGPLSGALLLAESAGERVFEQLVQERGVGSWRVRPAGQEPQTLIAESGGREVAIICGRQVRCALGLEALALGTTAVFAEGRELDDTVARIIAAGALAVVPWGFGKWGGRAGGAVRKLFDTSSSASLFAGDNGGRLRLFGRPALLDNATRLGIRVLPGTDPFPFGGDFRRVGDFGFLAPAPDPNAPFQSLRAWLDSGGRPAPYGRGLGPFRFLFNQCGIQLYNRFMPIAR